MNKNEPKLILFFSINHRKIEGDKFVEKSISMIRTEDPRDAIEALNKKAFVLGFHLLRPSSTDIGRGYFENAWGEALRLEFMGHLSE